MQQPAHFPWGHQQPSTNKITPVSAGRAPCQHRDLLRTIICTHCTQNPAPSPRGVSDRSHLWVHTPGGGCHPPDRPQGTSNSTKDPQNCSPSFPELLLSQGIHPPKFTPLKLLALQGISSKYGVRGARCHASLLPPSLSGSALHLAPAQIFYFPSVDLKPFCLFPKRLDYPT